MHVAKGRMGVFVSQKLLDRQDVAAVSDHYRGATMSGEDVNAASLLNTCTFLIFYKNPVDVSPVHSLAGTCLAGQT